MNVQKNDTFGLMKTLIDAHTMGINAAADLLRECGYYVEICPLDIEEALEKVFEETSQNRIIKWIKEKNIRHIGFSYRLDCHDAINIIDVLISVLKKNGMLVDSSNYVKSIYFAGLPQASNIIKKKYNGFVRTFQGGESPEETLMIMGIPQYEIPKNIIEGCSYDKQLYEFGKNLIEEGKYQNIKSLERNKYLEYGTMNDNIIKRISYNFKEGFNPLIRAHYGPYSAEISREECLDKYNTSCRYLAKSGYLDILSIGTSQLSQSDFGNDWNGKINGGGVPVNSDKEYYNIWKAARPMLVRTYSSTQNIKKMAEMYERTINNSWNALSLWWFNELDGRGTNSLYNGLKENFDTIKYIAKIGKPLETNVPHHFAFRGCDDITYIISAYLGAKIAKKNKIKTFILQNMLNTPRSTWGVQDLAKSRAMLNIVRELEDDTFKVLLQTRAGLDYFKPDINIAKIQLAAVTAMMDDIEPSNLYSPEIIHVVSYSEALFLATPDIINDSIKITRQALSDYRNLKRYKIISNIYNEEIVNRTSKLEKSARTIIKYMENYIDNLYTPEGLYIAFVSGWLPVPALWSNSDEFIYAKDWNTRLINGGNELISNNELVSIDSRVNKCVSRINDAKYILKNKY